MKWFWHGFRLFVCLMSLLNKMKRSAILWCWASVFKKNFLPGSWNPKVWVPQISIILTKQFQQTDLPVFSSDFQSSAYSVKFSIPQWKWSNQNKSSPVIPVLKMLSLLPCPRVAWQGPYLTSCPLLLYSAQQSCFVMAGVTPRLLHWSSAPHLTSPFPAKCCTAFSSDILCLALGGSSWIPQAQVTRILHVLLQQPLLPLWHYFIHTPRTIYWASAMCQALLSVLKTQ